MAEGRYGLIAEWIFGPGDSTTLATSPFSGVRIGDRYFGLCNGPLTMTSWLAGYEYECAQDIDAQGVTDALARPTRVKVLPTGEIRTYYPGGGPATTGRVGLEPRLEALSVIAAREAAERRALYVQYATYAGGALLAAGLLYYAMKGA